VKLTIAFLVTAVFSAGAMAEMDITGKYTFLKYTCESGAEPNLQLDSELMKGQLTGQLDVTAEMLNFKMQLFYQLNADFAHFSLEALREELAGAMKLPDSDSKTATISYLNDEIKNIENMAAGQTCEFESGIQYSIEGDKISSSTKTFSSTCEGMSTEKDKDDVQRISLADGVLKFTLTDQSNQTQDANCAQDDDHVVMVFTKK
jgi:hypothetical protein